MMNSDLRVKIERLPPFLRWAALGALGPALDVPDGAKAWPLIRGMLRQLHLFAPVHLVIFAALGVAVVKLIPVSAACEPRMIQLARLTMLVLYEVVVVPPLTLTTALLARRYFRDPYSRHAGDVSLVLLMALLFWILCSTALSFTGTGARMRGVAIEVLTCAYGPATPFPR